MNSTSNKLKYFFFSDNSNSFVQYFRFVVSGGIGAGIAIASFFYLISYFALNHIIANSISYFFGWIAEYLLNRFWVFHAKKSKGIRNISAFFIVSLGCLVLSNIVIYILVDLNVLFSIYNFENQDNLKLTAKIISVLLNSIWDFFAKKIIVFKHKKD